VIVYHVAVTTADDFLTRREPHRQATFEYWMALRAAGALIAGGAARDGASYDLVCRARQPADLRDLIEKTPFFAEGLWTAYTPRTFSDFVEPWQLAPPRPDEARIATIVEGKTPDTEMASFALIEERGAGRLLCGGFFPDGASLALMSASDPDAALAALDASGLFTPGSLRARAIAHIV
jgi:uncharacterized protein YciI